MQRLLDSVKKLEEKHIYMKAEIDSLTVGLEHSKKNHADALAKSALYADSAQLLREVALKCQTETVNKIANICTKLYQFVFQTEDLIVIDLDVKRKVPVASVQIKSFKDGQETLLDPVEEEGGGKCDVISLGLRLAGLLLFAPALNRVLILDEPFRFISTSESSAKTYLERTAEFLKQICVEYQIQVIAVTHSNAISNLADQKFTLSLNGEGYSVVE